jgi:hypothetical protein
MFEGLYAASNTKGSVVHIGTVGEVPDFLAWSTEEANASIAIVAAREEPGFRDEAAQLGPKYPECLSHRQSVAPEKYKFVHSDGVALRPTIADRP